MTAEPMTTEPIYAEEVPRSSAPPLGQAVAGILRRPQRLIAVWNWKSALLSVTLRGPIFFTAAFSHGAKAALGALLAETVFCALGVGLYNALVQSLREAEPLWLTGVLLSVVFPGCVQVGEYVMHRLRGTPHLHAAVIASLCVSSVSTLFNWYAMRQGAMMVGRQSSSLGADLRRLPTLIFGFVALPVQWVLRRGAGRARQAV